MLALSSDKDGTLIGHSTNPEKQIVLDTVSCADDRLLVTAVLLFPEAPEQKTISPPIVRGQPPKRPGPPPTLSYTRRAAHRFPGQANHSTAHASLAEEGTLTNLATRMRALVESNSSAISLSATPASRSGPKAPGRHGAQCRSAHRASPAVIRHPAMMNRLPMRFPARQDSSWDEVRALRHTRHPQAPFVKGRAAFIITLQHRARIRGGRQPLPTRFGDGVDGDVVRTSDQPPPVVKT